MSNQNLEVVSIVLVVLLILYSMAGLYFQHVHFHLLHQTGLGILLGFVCGAIVYFTKAQQLKEDIFSQELFFYGILPLIIFAGGFNLKKRKFFKNFFYISLYGLVGTLVSFSVIALLTIAIRQMGLIYDLDGLQIKLQTKTILLFASTICATDSVAALTLIKSSQFPKLFSVIFGEGMVNDAVSIILFKAVFDISQSSQDFRFSTSFIILGNFFLNLIVSLGIGVLAGVFAAFTFKRMRFLSSSPVIQVVLCFLFGILAYMVLQALQFSGVIGVLVAGIVLSHYAIYNFSLSGQLTTCITFQSFSLLAESFLFIYLGFVIWSFVPNKEIHRQYTWSWVFILLQIAICLIARFCSVYVVSGLAYLFRRKKWDLDIFQLAIVWFAGAIRGSVAFALILTITPEQNNPEDQRSVQLLRSSVLVIVFLTTVIMGGMMPWFIKTMLYFSKKRKGITQDQGSVRDSLVQNSSSSNKKPGMFKLLDQTYFKPALIYQYEDNKDKIKQFKKNLKLNSSEFKGGDFVNKFQHAIRMSLKADVPFRNTFRHD